MALRPNAFVVTTGALLLTSFLACGRPDDANIANLQSQSDVRESAFFADTSSIQDVSLRDRDGESSVISPSYLPKAGESAVELELIFYPRFSVPAQSKFVYDKTKWTIVVGKNSEYVTSTNFVSIQESANFSSGEIREGEVKIRFRLTALPQWPDKLTNDSALDIVDGRKALKIQPYYSLEGAVPPGNSGTIQGLSAAYMKDDVGAIVAPAEIGSPVVTDGAFSFDFKIPSDTTAADTSTGSVTSVGKSNVSGFVVVYWKDSECRAGGWNFKPNKVFDKTKASGDLACAYGGLDAAVAGRSSCSLGCSTDVSDDFFGKSANDIAVPPEYPTANGIANGIKRGCLNIVRVARDGRTSFALNDASNNETYGAMVYPLDSAGNIGLTRSRCIKAQTFNVVFPSSQKSPDLGKSKSDCMVVTAASGSKKSLSVHYWRILRDVWLDRLGVSQFYYKHAPRWAQWLEQNPRYKPAFNAFFEWSGGHLVKVSQWLNRLSDWSEQSTERVFSLLRQVFVSEAHASETPPGAEEKEVVGLKHPHGSASTTLMFGGAQIRPSQDKELYDLSYKNKKPTFLFLAQSFRVLDLAGEIGLGYEGSGVFMNGVSADSNKAKIALSGIGIGGLAEYRLRVGERPWVSPRFSFVVGKMRMREEAAAVSTGGDSNGTPSEISPSGTTPVWQTYTTARGTLDVSISRLYGDDENLIRYGYDVEDLTLSLFAAMHTNNGKVISTSGLQLGGGFTFLFQ